MSTAILTAGIHSISEEDYHADKVADVPSLSASIAKILIAESPLHAWTAHPKLNPNFVRVEKEIFDLGTVSHALMLQGLKAATILDFPDWRKKDAQEARDAARAQRLTPILTKHWIRVQAMVEAGKRQIAAHREAKDAFTDVGKPEQSIAWEDEATDGTKVLCRSRIDWLRNDFKRIYDYKGTGTSVNPEYISRFAVSQGWDIQSAFYRRGVKKITGVDADFFFVAQEDYEPYALTVVGMGPDFAWAGEKKVQQAIDVWADCTESGKWPAYPDRTVYPALPSYEETRITEKELREV